jgi:ABC-2 type transport system permease protein
MIRLGTSVRAVGVSPRPRLFPSIFAFLDRDLRVARSYKVSFILGIASVGLSLVSFRFISTLVGTGAVSHGVGDYFGFVVVGLAMGQMLDVCLTAPAASVRLEQVQGTLEVIAVTPLTPASLACGWLAYPVLSSLITSAMTLAIAGPLGLRFSAHPNIVGAILSFLLGTLSFAGIGILVAAVVLVIQQAASVTKWLIAGLGLISGVLFPISLFPRWVGILSQASPLTHALRAVRGALLAGQGLGDLAPDLLALALSAAIMLPGSIVILSLALRRARRTGAIATY